MQNEFKNYRAFDEKLTKDERDRKFKTWYHKTFNRPQRSRHTRTKKGCK